MGFSSPPDKCKKNDMKKNYFLTAFMFVTLLSFSQDGSPDTSFGNNGKVETDFGNDWDSSQFITVTPSGNIFVTVWATALSPNNRLIMGYLPDGNINNSFGSNGVWNDPAFQNPYLALKNTGEDVLVLTTNLLEEYLLIKLLQDGNLDTSFGTNGVLILTDEIIINDFIVRSDNRILVLGKLGTNSEVIILKQYLPNGSIDSAFGTNGEAVIQVATETNAPSKMVVDDSGFIYVSGKFKNTGEDSINGVVKVSSLGVVDSSFGNNGIATIPADISYYCGEIGLLSDGSIISYCTYVDNVNEIIYSNTYKTSPEGFHDSSFGQNGIVDSFGGGGILIQENDRIIVYDLPWDFFEGGGNLVLRRFYSTGVLDSTFEYQNNFSEFGSMDVTFQPDGKILATGGSMWYNGNPNVIVLRYNNTVLGINEVNSQEFSIYPNPSKGEYTIQFSEMTGQIPFQLYDFTGKLVASGLLTKQNTQINIANLPSGMYLFKTPKGLQKIIKN